MTARNPFRNRPTIELHAEARWIRARIDELRRDGSPDPWCGASCVASSIAINQLDLADIGSELARQERLRSSLPRDRSALIQRIKEQLPIDEFLMRQGVEVHRQGRRRAVCLCPLHGEKTPSFVIYPDGRFHCFGCGKYGDVIDLSMALWGESDFVRNLERLASLIGLSVDRGAS